MSEEAHRKTLANCKNSEFLSRANTVRKKVYDFYHCIDFKKIIERYNGKYENEDETADTVYNLICDVIDAIMCEHPAETVELVSILAFMAVDEAEELPPAELYAILLECAMSQRVLDFFICVEKSAGSDMGGILPALIILRAISSGMNISSNESKSSTTDTSEK